MAGYRATDRGEKNMVVGWDYTSIPSTGIVAVCVKTRWEKKGSKWVPMRVKVEKATREYIFNLTAKSELKAWSMPGQRQTVKFNYTPWGYIPRMLTVTFRGESKTTYELYYPRADPSEGIYAKRRVDDIRAQIKKAQNPIKRTTRRK